MPLPPRQIPFDLGNRPAYAPGDFRLSGCNRDASGWIGRWPNWPAPLLILFGPEGSGKTHLSEVWRARSRAVSGMDPVEAPAFLLDDADRTLLGTRAGEEALFHLYNHAAATGRHILMTASAPPAAWPVALPDLKSRLEAAPAVALLPPDDGLMGLVLVKLFSDRQLLVSPDVVAFLVPRMERSFAAVRALVEKIDRQALAGKRPVTVPFVRALLQEDTAR